jgi:hypothetical protein
MASESILARRPDICRATGEQWVETMKPVLIAPSQPAQLRGVCARRKAALSSGCKSHPATDPIRKKPEQSWDSAVQGNILSAAAMHNLRPERVINSRQTMSASVAAFFESSRRGRGRSAGLILDVGAGRHPRRGAGRLAASAAVSGLRTTPCRSTPWRYRPPPWRVEALAASGGRRALSAGDPLKAIPSCALNTTRISPPPIPWP